MACFHPREVWWSGIAQSLGLKRLAFCAAKSNGEPSFLIPCNQCAGCRIAHGSGWAVRLMNESKEYLFQSFLTMTYDQEHVPKNGSLCKRDVQLFMKRLRKHYPGLDIRYFVCGEYGDRNGRPHYHMILFGLAFIEDRRAHSKNGAGDQLYVSATLDKLWGKGNCLIGSVSPQSCGYVAQYAFKKVNGKKADEHYRRVDPVSGETWVLVKEFATMSKKPAIGLRYFEKYHEQVYLRGSCVMRGKEVPIPKYYDRKLRQLDELWYEDVKLGRKQEAEKHLDDQTPERLAVREEVTLARRKTFQDRKL